MQQFVDSDCQDRSNSVNGIVTRQALADKTLQRVADHSLIGKSKLIFNNDMKGSMRQEIRNLNAGVAMKLLDHLDSFAFVEPQPLIWNRRILWIVTFHQRFVTANVVGNRPAAPMLNEDQGMYRRVRLTERLALRTDV